MLRRSLAAPLIVLFSVLPALAAVCDLSCEPAAATETCPGHQQPLEPPAPSGCSHDHDTNRAVLRADTLPKVAAIERATPAIAAGSAAEVAATCLAVTQPADCFASLLARQPHSVPLRI